MVVLLVLFMIISFLTIDYFVNRAERRRGMLATPRRVARSAARRERRKTPGVDPAQLPGGVFVAPGHVWLKVEPSGTVAVGVDRLMLSLLGGEVDCVYAMPEGSELHDGGPLLMLRRGHRALRIRSPVSGVISGVNDRVRRAPQRISADPFDGGWIYRVSPSHLADSLKKTRVAEDASIWMRRELARLRELAHGAMTGEVAQLTMADGGVPDDSLPELLDNRDWECLVERFFSAETASATASAGNSES